MMLLSSGCTVLDLALGGGYPFGEIVNIVGPEGSSKTWMATECIYNALLQYKDKLKWRFNDAERRFNLPVKELYGIDMNIKDPSLFLEEFQDDVSKWISKLKDKDKLIYILDSLDQLPSLEEIRRSKKKSKAREDGEESEKKKGKGSFNLEKLKELNTFFRVKRDEIKNKDCLLIIISQVRMNIGVLYGPVHNRTGGKALDHNASQIIWFKEVERYGKKGWISGVCIKAEVKKNSIGKPFRECFFDLLFDYGIDNISSNIDFLYDLRTDMGKFRKKEAEELEWNKKKYNKTELIQLIEKKNLEEELEQKVVKKWNEIEEAISSKNRKERMKWSKKQLS